MGTGRSVIAASVLGLLAGGCAFVTRASVGPGGVEGNANSLFAAPISADGRYVAFTSDASNLVVGDANGTADVFRRDSVAGTTQLVSVASDGTQATDASYATGMSGDGRYVVFSSPARNLVTGDANGSADVFVRDMVMGTNDLVSVASDGTQGNDQSGGGVPSADGRFVMFTSTATNLVPGDTNGDPPCPEPYDCGSRGADVFVRDRLAHTTERVSVANGGSQADDGSAGQVMTPDGRFVVFVSRATNLVAGDTTNQLHVYVRDRMAHTTERVDVASDGTIADSFARAGDISADGRYVAFTSAADNLVPGDLNGHDDLFVRDRQTGTTERLSVTSAGAEVAFGTGEHAPSISADGRFVAFTSLASDLVSNDTNGAEDVFVADRLLHTTTRVSTGLLGTQGDSPHRIYPLSVDPRISADGRYVSFWSQAETLVADDTNQRQDVFVKFIATPTLTATNPPTVARGANTTLTVSGGRFTTGVFGVSLGPGVSVTDWHIQSDTELSVTASLSNTAAPGVRDLLVFAPGTGGGLQGGIAVCAGCLTIT